VPYWAIVRLYGRNATFGYRLELSIGRNSTDGQRKGVASRLRSLVRCGLVERESTSRGVFTLFVFLPFASKTEQPKKITPTPLLDSLENPSENPSEKPRGTSSVFQIEKPSGIPRETLNAEQGKRCLRTNTASGSPKSPQKPRETLLGNLS
jgi:hypothetical protein